LIYNKLLAMNLVSQDLLYDPENFQKAMQKVLQAFNQNSALNLSEFSSLNRVQRESLIKVYNYAKEVKSRFQAKIDLILEDILFQSFVDGNYDVAQGLILAGVRVDCHNKDGERPLLIAIERNDMPMFRLALYSGADPVMPNVKEITPVRAAITLGQLEMVGLLLSFINERDQRN
jgi:ankyrin repeat protein